MKEHKIHVFYSNEDKQSYRIIGSLLKRLELSARYWNSRKSPGLPALTLNFQNTTDALLPLTEEQFQEINSTQDSVIMLVAPNLLLSENLLTSQAGKELLEGNAESLRLFVYCQKIAFREVLVTSRSNHCWITGTTGQHITYGTAESTVDDAACDANQEIQKCLELWFATNSRPNKELNVTPKIDQKRETIMNPIAENLLNAEIDLLKAKRRTDNITLNNDTAKLSWALACNFILSAGITFFVPLLSIYAGILALIIFAWAILICSALWLEYKAEKAYDRASTMETAYDLRTGLIGAD